MTMRHLLASDLDGTLFPSRPDPRHRGAVVLLHALLRRRPELVLAYVTGRNLALSLQAIAQWRLPWPDFLCPDMGTAVYRRYGDRWREDAHYRRRMERGMGDVTGAHLLAILEEIDGVRPQDPAHQSPFKTSFVLAPGQPGQRTVQWVERTLRDLGYDLTCVASRDINSQRILLDILPAGVDKGTVVAYLQHCLGLTADRVVYCGDSGNDLGAMRRDFRVILPANADPELRRELRALGCFTGDRPRCYLSSHPHLWGVLDGCRHFGLG